MPEPQFVAKILSVDVIPTADGGYLDVMTDHGLERFHFTNVSQLTTFSQDARRVALIATGYEELTVESDQVRPDDLVPSIGGGRVYSRDVETKAADDPAEDPRRIVHLTFSGTEAVLSIPERDGLNIVRSVRSGKS